MSELIGAYVVNETETSEIPSGAFVASLKRNNAKIRSDRAEAIAENAHTLYRRRIEDLQMNIRQLKRDRDNMLDLSPSDAQSLKLASDFNAQEFVEKDIAMGIKLRNLEIELQIAAERFNYLFVNTAGMAVNAI